MIYVHEYLSIKQIKYLEEINKGIYLKKGGGERKEKEKYIRVVVAGRIMKNCFIVRRKDVYKIVICRARFYN
jgi:hypothetical protein